MVVDFESEKLLRKYCNDFRFSDNEFENYVLAKEYIIKHGWRVDLRDEEDAILIYSCKFINDSYERLNECYEKYKSISLEVRGKYE